MPDRYFITDAAAYLNRSPRAIRDAIYGRPHNPLVPDGYVGRSPWFTQATLNAYNPGKPGRKRGKK